MSNTNLHAALTTLLSRLDWTYEYSDDHRAWEAGNRSWKELKRLVALLSHDPHDRAFVEAEWDRLCPRSRDGSIFARIPWPPPPPTAAQVEASRIFAEKLSRYRELEMQVRVRIARFDQVRDEKLRLFGMLERARVENVDRGIELLEEALAPYREAVPT